MTSRRTTDISYIVILFSDLLITPWGIDRLWTLQCPGNIPEGLFNKWTFIDVFLYHHLHRYIHPVEGCEEVLEGATHHHPLQNYLEAAPLAVWEDNARLGQGWLCVELEQIQALEEIADRQQLGAVGNLETTKLRERVSFIQ